MTPPPASPRAQRGGAPLRPRRDLARLLLLLALFVLPLAAGAFWVYVQMEREITAAELQRGQLRARALAALVEHEFRSTVRLLVSVAERRSFREAWQRGDAAALDRHLEDILELEPALLFASVYTPDGTLRAIAPSDPIVGDNFAYRDWYRGVAAGWQPYVSEVYRTAAHPQTLVVAVAVPIRDAAGQPAGILMAPYQLDVLAQKFSALEAGGGGVPVVVDARGVIAAAPGVDPAREPAPAPAPELVRRALAGEEASGRMGVDAEDEQIAALAPVHGLGWAVLYLRPAREALAGVYRARRVGLSVALYLFVIYAATSWLAFRLLVRQRRAEAELRRAHEELERRVAARTTELAESRRHLATLLSNLPGMAYRCRNDTEWTMEFVSEGAALVTGYRPEDLIDNHRASYGSLIHPEDRDAVWNRVQRALGTAQPFEIEYCIRHASGDERWVHEIGRGVYDAAGRLEAIEGFIHDITPRRRAQQALERANRELEARVAERTAALEAANRDLEAFSYSVSHDLRAPLRHLDGFSRILLEDLGPRLDDGSRAHLERIRAAVAEMGNLIDDLLALSRVGRHRLSCRRVRLEDIVLEARAELEAEAEDLSRAGARGAGGGRPAAGGEIEWRIGALPEVECDPGLVKQVFVNLLANAVKFSSRQAQAVVEVGAEETGGETVIYVRDNGVGFDSRYAGKLFAVFQRLHSQEEFPGTGVGLAIVARIIAGHGGRVWAESAPGQGTTFYFTLAPARPERTPRGAAGIPGQEPVAVPRGGPPAAEALDEPRG